MADTNITKEDQKLFEALTSGEYDNFALFSCFVDGEPSCAIVSIEKTEIDPGTTQFLIKPQFVRVTDNMILTDHDNVAAAELDDGAGDAIE